MFIHRALAHTHALRLQDRVVQTVQGSYILSMRPFSRTMFRLSNKHLYLGINALMPPNVHALRHAYISHKYGVSCRTCPVWWTKSARNCCFSAFVLTIVNLVINNNRKARGKIFVLPQSEQQNLTQISEFVADSSGFPLNCTSCVWQRSTESMWNILRHSRHIVLQPIHWFFCWRQEQQGKRR